MSDWLLNAQNEFTAGTGFNSPDNVVRAKLRTAQEWCDILEKYRPATNPRNLGNFTTESQKKVIPHAALQKLILEILDTHCKKKLSGLTITELSSSASVNIKYVYSIVLNLHEMGILERVNEVGRKKYYRIAGLTEVTG